MKIIRPHATDKIFKYKAFFSLPDMNSVSSVHSHVIKSCAAFLPLVNIVAKSASPPVFSKIGKLNKEQFS